MELNKPEVVAEVTALFERYEAALMANDVETLNALFWTDPRVLRYGPSECLYGHQAIRDYRTARDVTGIERRLTRTVITTFGNDVATANTEYERLETGRIGRQSQTWVRFPEGWRIASAHVSLLP